MLNKLERQIIVFRKSESKTFMDLTLNTILGLLGIDKAKDLCIKMDYLLKFRNKMC